jgi:cytochrome c553
MGSGDFPGIASRSPSYMMRQLWDMKRGTRNGVYTVLMKPVVADLTADDLTSIVAYLASIPPPKRATTSSQ